MSIREKGPNMVGGRIIEMKRMRVLAGPYPGQMTDVIRLWVHNPPDDECAVFAEPAPIMPAMDEEIWWQGGRIYFDGDRQSLKKIGFSFDPRSKLARSSDGYFP